MLDDKNQPFAAIFFQQRIFFEQPVTDSTIRQRMPLSFLC